MVDYLYDGSFEGLLTCIYHHYYEEKASGIYTREAYQANMLGESREVGTQADKADKVYKAIGEKISAYDLRRIYKVFLSAETDREMKILRYVVLGFKTGANISRLHGDPTVFAVQRVEKKVNMEIHRLLGLIRFSVLGEHILYSSIEPDHDILEFLAAHFCDRFKNESFIIHDTKRSKALISHMGKWYISDFYEERLPEIPPEEKQYRRLWQSYFENIAIKERTNPRCQKTMMPVRYWKNLTEMKGSSDFPQNMI